MIESSVDIDDAEEVCPSHFVNVMLGGATALDGGFTDFYLRWLVLPESQDIFETSSDSNL